MNQMLLPREPAEIAPGAVHVPGWLSLDEQCRIVEACRGWALGPVPMRAARLPGGHQMSVQTVCLGWHWQPYKYTRTADDAGGGAVAELPDWLVELGRKALAAAYLDGPRRNTESDSAGFPDAGFPDAGYPDADAVRRYTPDTALINYYDDAAKMGMHQDKDEKAAEPVVSLSIGDTCLFRCGNTETRNKPYTDVELMSGDLFVFGGPSRFAFHGVPKTFPGTADPASGLKRGRINITMRVTGLR